MLEEEFEEQGYCSSDLINLKRYHALHLLKVNNGFKALVTKLPSELKTKDSKDVHQELIV